MSIIGINHRSLAAEIMRELGITEKCITKFEETGDIVYCNSSGFTCVSDIMDEQLWNTIAAEMRDCPFVLFGVTWFPLVLADIRWLH